MLIECTTQKVKRQRGGIEPLHVSMPHELKSCPSTSLTHPGLLALLLNTKLSDLLTSEELRLWGVGLWYLGFWGSGPGLFGPVFLGGLFRDTFQLDFKCFCLDFGVLFYGFGGFRIAFVGCRFLSFLVFESAGR